MAARDREQVINRLHLGALLRQAVIHAMDTGVSREEFARAAEDEFSAVTAEVMAPETAEGSVPK